MLYKLRFYVIIKSYQNSMKSKGVRVYTVLRPMAITAFTL